MKSHVHEMTESNEMNAIKYGKNIKKIQYSCWRERVAAPTEMEMLCHDQVINQQNNRPISERYFTHYNTGDSHRAALKPLKLPSRMCSLEDSTKFDKILKVPCLIFGAAKWSNGYSLRDVTQYFNSMQCNYVVAQSKRAIQSANQWC